MNAVCVMIVFVCNVVWCYNITYSVSILFFSLYASLYIFSTLPIQEDFRISVITSLNKLSHHPLEASLLIAVWDADLTYIGIVVITSMLPWETTTIYRRRASFHSHSHKRWRAVDRRQRVQYPRACVTTYFKCMNCANDDVLSIVNSEERTS